MCGNGWDSGALYPFGFEVVTLFQLYLGSLDHWDAHSLPKGGSTMHLERTLQMMEIGIAKTGQ